MTGDTGRLRVLPGLRKGNLLTEPFDPLPGIPLMGIKPFSMPCSSCGEPARWHLRACPGTGHEGGAYVCERHLAPVHRSLLGHVTRLHEHEGK
jgi:hypothetical protein